MIVNPQLFNYRLIIGTLVVAIVVLGSYSFSSYNTLKNHEQFVQQEVNLVQSELSDMIVLYDEVSVDNKELALQLQQSKSRMEIILDSLKIAKANFPLISKYKNEIAALNQERKVLFKQIQTIQNKNNDLVEEAQSVSEKLDMQANQITMLAEENKKLSEDDVMPIAIGQMKLENELVKKANEVLICDTNLLETMVYSKVYYPSFCNQELEKFAVLNSYNLYFLTYIDTPWKADDLRDKPNERESIFLAFEETLLKNRIPFVLLKGNEKEVFTFCPHIAKVSCLQITNSYVLKKANLISNYHSYRL